MASSGVIALSGFPLGLLDALIGLSSRPWLLYRGRPCLLLFWFSRRASGKLNRPTNSGSGVHLQDWSARCPPPGGPTPLGRQQCCRYRCSIRSRWGAERFVEKSARCSAVELAWWWPSNRSVSKLLAPFSIRCCCPLFSFAILDRCSHPRARELVRNTLALNQRRFQNDGCCGTANCTSSGMIRITRDALAVYVQGPRMLCVCVGAVKSRCSWQSCPGPSPRGREEAQAHRIVGGQQNARRAETSIGGCICELSHAGVYAIRFMAMRYLKMALLVKEGEQTKPTATRQAAGDAAASSSDHGVCWRLSRHIIVVKKLLDKSSEACVDSEFQEEFRWCRRGVRRPLRLVKSCLVAANLQAQERKALLTPQRELPRACALVKKSARNS